MINVRGVLMAVSVALSAPAHSDSITLSDLLNRPEPLSTFAANADDPAVRCFSFFTAVFSLYGLSMEYGDARNVFDWVFEPNVYGDLDETHQAASQATDDVMRYIAAFSPPENLGTHPSVIVQHPIYVADKAYCLSSVSENS